jgi:fimbrial chaperone protein
MTMLPTRSILLAAFGLIAAGAIAPAAIAGIAISPVVIEIASPRQAIAVKITNNSDTPITLQSDVFTWRQIDGVDRDELTNDMLVVPPIVEVAAQASQVFRIMLRAPTPLPIERTYHLLLEDISEAQVTDGTSQLTFTINHRLPILIAPAGKIITAARWKPCTAASKAPAAGQACVRVRNAGNRRIKVQALTLAGAGWQQKLTLAAGVNVLAGAEREWQVPLLKDQHGDVHAVQVHTAHDNTLEAENGGF